PMYNWESSKIGGASPPIKTKDGWLTLYHGVGEDMKYRVGAMLLDTNNPSVVTHRTPKPLLVPEYDYENKGIYKGICFPCGNVVIDETLYVYYGGADQYVGVATCSLDLLLEHLRDCPVR
ncbi:MAG: glycosidase, partial [Bacteroidales bacterium]|nr:glycosidase [Bacteroidales bacterium]